MDSELLIKCSLLNELIHDSNEYKEYIEMENKINNNEELMRLAYKKDLIIMDYEDAINHYGRNSKEVLSINIKLKEVMDEINKIEDVKIYYEKLNNLNKLYEEIDNKLFNFIKD